MSSNTVLINVNKIKANTNQPRLEFNDETLNELAQSIKENGLIQPITVREIEDHYEIIAGERRYRACILAGFEEVQCIVIKSDDIQSAQLALVENIQRENLTAIEEAKAIKRIMEQTVMTQEEMAKKMGKAQSTIANKLRLLNLPEYIQEAVSNRKLTERHARALLQVDQEDLEQAYMVVLNKGFNVKQTEHYIDTLKEKEEDPKKTVTKGYSKNIKIGINTINQAVMMCKKTGIDVEVETVEKDNEVQLVVKFKK